MTDFNDPAQRLAYLDAHGHEAYNAAMRRHLADSTIETVNGYPIRPVPSRFGQLYALTGTDIAFSTLEQARAHARSLPARKEA